MAQCAGTSEEVGSASLSLKKAERTLKSSSSSSEREVLDCAGECLEYIVESGKESVVLQSAVGRAE